MKELNFKLLNQPVKVEEIDFRIQSINNGKYATILAYKDARYDMNVLDEVVGAENWQKDYKIIDGRLYCGVAIRCGAMPDQWVWKWDVGTESNTEKEKGQASDSFKRACFNWGIGRELYSFPVISVKLNDSEVEQYEFNNKKIYKANYTLKVNDWKWYIGRDDSGKIAKIGARDSDNKVRYNYDF